MEDAATARRPRRIPAVRGRGAGGAARLLRWGLIALGIAAVVHAGGLSIPGLSSSIRELGRLGRPVVLLTLALEVGAVLTLANVYRASLRAVRADLPYGRSLGVSMSAFTVSRIVPAGGAMGAVVAGRRLAAEGIAPALASAAVVLMGVLSMLTLAILVSTGAAAAAVQAGVPTAFAWFSAALALVVAGIAVAVVAALRSPTARERGLLAMERLAARFDLDAPGWRRAFDLVAADPPGPARVAAVMAWSALNWAFDIAVVWLLFRSAGHPVSLGLILVGYGVANVGAVVPLTPGGLGFVEAGMAGTYAAFGVPAASAITIVLAYRLVSFWLPAAAGVPVYLRGPRPRAPQAPIAGRRARADRAPARRAPLALQGGMEHQPGCEPIDDLLLELTGADDPLVVLVPAASAPRRREHTIRVGVDYWRERGARVAVADLDRAEPGLTVVEAADLDRAEPGLTVVEAADLVVLPGGSPTRLRSAMAGSVVWERIVARHAEGVALSGASAGAMVLGERIPRLRPPDPMHLVPATRLLPNVGVAPHYELPLVRRWAHRVADAHPELTVIGLDERTGLVAADGRTFTVLGQGVVTLLVRGEERTYEPGGRVTLDELVATG